MTDFNTLQQKLFGRWVHQKVSKVGLKCENLLEDFKDGTMLVALMEVLSDTKIDKPLKATTMRVKMADNAQRAMDFVKACGVDMKRPPSSEDLMDGADKAILGLLWEIMLKFMKFGDEDDEDTMNARDSLLMWCKNKTNGYENVAIKDFTKSWHNGLALCALIHKHRPSLIDFDSLSASNGAANIETAFEAAGKYFQLEKYLTVEDLLALDEKCMVIYVSDYYYGIAEMRKLDLAAKRIGKVIKLTVENDKIRAEYNEKATAWKGLTEKNTAILEDKTIDNTMAGAVERLDRFYKYKAEDKGTIIASQLDLEALYNNLAVILVQNNRPEFKPEHSLADIAAGVTHLEECEKERKIALHAELNRQHKLARMNTAHEARYNNLVEYSAAKKAYLETKEVIESVSEAQLQISKLDAFNTEFAQMKDTSQSVLSSVGAELISEKFEHSVTVQERMDSIIASFAELDTLAAAKKPVLDDALKREEYKDKINLDNESHIAAHTNIDAWVTVQNTYLERNEEIDSIADARRALVVLSNFEADKEKQSEHAVASLKALGQSILDAEYKTEYSEWVFPAPEEVTGRQDNVDSSFTKLGELAVTKKERLDAALALELEKERLRLEFARVANSFRSWAEERAKEVEGEADFGFLLEEVEAYQAKMDENIAADNAKTSATKDEYTGLDGDLTSKGVTENKYTDLSVGDLGGIADKLTEAHGKRAENYKVVLEKARADDALCKKFAGLVEPFCEGITQQKNAVATSEAELEAQLADVDAKLGSIEEDTKNLDPIIECDGEVTAAGITNNRYTVVTLLDARVQWEQYGLFLTKKKAMLEATIERQRLRGVSQEELDEIEENFKQFDKNASGSISKGELKALMYSLGEEKSKQEIADLFGKYSGGAAEMPYDAFKELMISILGVSDTKEDILSGWALINFGSEIALVEKCELVVAASDMEYFTTTAPAVEGGYDYNAWTEDVFSR